MARPIGVLDRDDVLMHFMSPFSVWHNRMYGTNVRYEDITAYEFWTFFHIPDVSEAVARVRLFYHSSESADAPPWEGAFDLVESLHRNYDLVVVTAREEVDREITVSALDRHFDGLIREVIFTNQWASRPSVAVRSKSEVCKALGASFIIEDSPHTALDCHHAGIPSYTVARPWNRSLVLPGAPLPLPSSLEAIKKAILCE